MQRILRTRLLILLSVFILINNAIFAAVSTVNKTGENYNTLTLWEDAKDGVLGEVETAELYVEDGALDDRVVIDGSTTASDKYMKITVPASDRHAGVWSDSKSRIVPTSDGTVITVDDHYTVIEYLQIYPKGTSAESNGIGHSNSSDHNTYRYNLIDGHGSAYTCGISRVSSGELIYRNIIWHCARDWAGGILMFSGDANTYIVNNTIVGYGADYSYGIRDRSGTGSESRVINNAVFDCPYNFGSDTESWGAGSGYNATDSAAAPGSNNQVEKTSSSQFTSLTGGSENFHLKVGADCIDHGTDAGSPYDVDIDGDAEGATWDISADEYAAAAPPAASKGASQILILE